MLARAVVPFAVDPETLGVAGCRGCGAWGVAAALDELALGAAVVALVAQGEKGGAGIKRGAGFAGFAEGGDAAGVFVLQGEGPAGQAERIGAVGAGAEVPLGAERGAAAAEAAEAAGWHALNLAGFAAAGLQGEATGGTEPFAGQAAQGGRGQVHARR